MTHRPEYASETRTSRFSLAALTSLLLGVIAGPDIVFVYTRIHDVTPSIPLQWVILIQMPVVPVGGLTLGIVAVTRRRRGWWLALIGIPLNALAVIFLLASLAMT